MPGDATFDAAQACARKLFRRGFDAAKASVTRAPSNC
jgi:hypothetical protein